MVHLCFDVLDGRHGVAALRHVASAVRIYVVLAMCLQAMAVT